MRCAAWALCAVAAGCAQANPPPQATLDPPPVDAARVRLEEVIEWRHRRTLEADVTGDGTSERIVLTADVTLNDAGVPLWEDGHRWALFVEEGERHTLVYGAFVPNGHAEAAVLSPDRNRAGRHLLVRERTPQHIRTIEIAYRGPASAQTVSASHHQVDQWVPSLTGSPR